MGLLSLLEVSLMPIIQVLLICMLGAFMATDYLNLFPPQTRRALNRIVFAMFTPSLIFTNLAKTVRLEDIISWWFMPVNIGIMFLLGGILGWIAVKILKPPPYLQYLVVAMCASGNLGSLMVILIPAMCEEDGNPFGDKSSCRTLGISYASLSMALGELYLWVYTYHLIQSSSVLYRASLPSAADDEEGEINPKHLPNKDLESSDQETPLLLTIVSESDHHIKQYSATGRSLRASVTVVWNNFLGASHRVLEELKAPPVLAAIIGFVFGAVSWLRNLVVGDNAPLKVMNNSIGVIGDATIPCINLILGGNLTQGLKKSKLEPKMAIAVIVVRYILLPAAGIGIVKAAAHFGLLSSDPLFQFVLMMQYALPPAMNIGTMTQLVDVAQDECSVLFLWTYVAAAFALTAWSTVFMWFLS